MQERYEQTAQQFGEAYIPHLHPFVYILKSMAGIDIANCSRLSTQAFIQKAESVYKVRVKALQSSVILNQLQAGEDRQGVRFSGEICFLRVADMRMEIVQELTGTNLFLVVQATGSQENFTLRRLSSIRDKGGHFFVTTDPAFSELKESMGFDSGNFKVTLDVIAQLTSTDNIPVKKIPSPIFDYTDNSELEKWIYNVHQLDLTPESLSLLNVPYELFPFFEEINYYFEILFEAIRSIDDINNEKTDYLYYRNIAISHCLTQLQNVILEFEKTQGVKYKYGRSREQIDFIKALVSRVSLLYLQEMG